jgi:hypothetical protein
MTTRQAEIEELRTLGLTTEEADDDSPPRHLSSIDEVEHRLAVAGVGKMASELIEGVSVVRRQAEDLDKRLRSLDIKLAAYEATDGDGVS